MLTLNWKSSFESHHWTSVDDTRTTVECFSIPDKRACDDNYENARPDPQIYTPRQLKKEKKE